MFVQAFDILKIPEHRFGTLDILKKVIFLSTLQHFFLVMQFSHESEHTKLMTSLIISLPLAVFYQQSLSCEMIDKSKGNLNSSNSNYSLCALPGRFRNLRYLRAWTEDQLWYIAVPRWTDRYWTAGGRLRAPCASMNFTLVISTKSHYSSPHGPMGPHRWCRRKSTLCHLLKSFDIRRIWAIYNNAVTVSSRASSPASLKL